jgi:Succinylglutamate desuccinylase / Aspartoacylase family
MNRILARIEGNSNGPTVILTGAIHGNEGTGVEALKTVIAEIESAEDPINGNLLALIGNMAAFDRKVRFIEEDLNRIWSKKAASNIESGEWNKTDTSHERSEQIELYDLVKDAFDRYNGPFVFVDLHSVSSRTVPFITIDDMLRNRQLASKFPVPVILGMEEFIQGSFLNRVNALGHMAIGFEAGRHDDPNTVSNHASFIRLVLHHSNVFHLEGDLLNIEEKQLDCNLGKRFFEIRYRHELHSEDQFQMKLGYENFDPIKANELLAHVKKIPLFAPFKGRLLMPLYQKMGNDGFFIARRVFVVALKSSEILRKFSWTRLLTILPGVRKDPDSKRWIRVNRHTARFLTIPIFHLLGYRCGRQSDKYLFFTRREINPHQ